MKGEEDFGTRCIDSLFAFPESRKGGEELTQTNCQKMRRLLLFFPNSVNRSKKNTRRGATFMYSSPSVFVLLLSITATLPKAKVADEGNKILVFIYYFKKWSHHPTMQSQIVY